MPVQSVVLTGATGSLGAAILEYLITSGIPVIVVLRSFQSAKPFYEQKYSKNVAAGTLNFAEIPDMTIPQAFHQVAEKASAIIHVATPLSTSNFMDTMIKPTVLITDNVLSAAESSSTVKRVIVTGSIVSVFQFSRLFETATTFSEADFNDITLEAAVTGVQTSYGYAKTAAERKAWDYIREKPRSFDLIFLLPPQIYGRSLQPGYKATKNELGGISAIYRELFDRDTVGSLFPYVIDIDDLADIHLKALDPSVPGNTRYILYSHIINTNKVAKAVRAKYPSLRSRVPAPTGDDAVPAVAKFDMSKADKVFGTEWKGWEESVYAIVDDILRYEEAHGYAA